MRNGSQHARRVPRAHRGAGAPVPRPPPLPRAAAGAAGAGGVGAPRGARAGLGAVRSAGGDRRAERRPGPRRAHPELPPWLDGALALRSPAERQLFEAYNKSLNILPVEELPVHRVDWEQWRHGATRRTPDCSTVTPRWRPPSSSGSAARARSPGSAFVERGGQRFLWGWGHVTVPRAVLYALFRTGQIGIARRLGNVRVYDRMERLFPSGAARGRGFPRRRSAGTSSSAGSVAWACSGCAPGRRFWSGTVPCARAVPAHRGDGRRRDAPPRPGAGRARRALHARLRRPLPPRRRRSARAEVALLAPLDPLVWDRELLRQLFDFDYVWEVYVPAKARKHGYYVLPLLWGDRLVGRIEPRIDRKAGVLRVPAPRLEHRMRRTERLELDAALDRALEAHRRLSGASASSAGELDAGRRNGFGAGRVSPARARCSARFKESTS